MLPSLLWWNHSWVKPLYTLHLTLQASILVPCYGKSGKVAYLKVLFSKVGSQAAVHW